MIVLSSFCKSTDIKLLIVFEFSVINKSCVVLSDMIEANVLLYAVFVLNKLVSFVYNVDTSAKIVDIVFPCPVISEEFELIILKFEVIVLLEFPTKNVLELIVLKFEVIVAFKLLIKKVLELILLAFVSSLIVFADMVGSIEGMVNPCAVILLRLLVIVVF